MELVLWCAAFSVVILPAIPTLVYAVECLAGSLPQRRSKVGLKGACTPRLAVAVLVPAHDEERGIGETLRSIRTQLRDGDQLLVVADNCSDATAAIARAAGAQVLERTDSVNRGKGYALDFGLKHLASRPCPIVVCVDADCTLVEGSLDELAQLAAATGRPVQSCNLMTASGPGQINQDIAEFAFRVKNLVRPRGLSRLGLPCLLTGTGMALPWELVNAIRMDHGELAEDMKLGMDLAAAGHAPLYCETAGVRSIFPETIAGAISQRSRWEYGHLAMIVATLPNLISPRVLGSRDRLAMTLDILVPPLTLLAFAHFAALVTGLLAIGAGLGSAPLVAAIMSAGILTVSTTFAWIAHGRDILPIRSLQGIPRYILGKAWIYPRALFGQLEHAWVRTDRSAR